MSNYEVNYWNTDLLVLNVMNTVARKLSLDIDDNEVSNKLYDICCDLEDWDEDQGFGSSDHYSYIKAAEKEFNISS